jgi:hypothetical protein
MSFINLITIQVKNVITVIKANSTIIICSVVFTFLVFVICLNTDVINIDFPWMETEGEILVNEPKVYTRERLVNDRFREEAWLLQQIGDDQMNNPAFAKSEAHIHNSIDRQTNINATGKIATDKSDQSLSNQDKKTDNSQQPTEITAADDIVLPPSDQFNEKLDYRDKVRNELMGIQLDDRHDIEGNTLYRLNFDTTIIPGSNTKSDAAILVKISPLSSDKSDDTDCGDYTDCGDDIECHQDRIDYKQIYDEWKKTLQLAVYQAHIDKRKILEPFNYSNNKDFEPNEQIKFEKFLRIRVYEETQKLISLLLKSNNIENKEEEKFSCKTEDTLDKAYMSDCDNDENIFNCEIEKLIDSFVKHYNLVKNEQEKKDYFEYLKEYTRLPDYLVHDLESKANKLCTDIDQNNEIKIWYSVRNKVIDVKKNIKQPHKPPTNNNKQPEYKTVNCPSVTEVSRILLVTLLIERIYGVQSILKDCPSNNNKSDNKKLCDELNEVKKIIKQGAADIQFKIKQRQEKGAADIQFKIGLIEELIRPYSRQSFKSQESSYNNNKSSNYESDKPYKYMMSYNDKDYPTRFFREGIEPLSNKPNAIDHILVDYAKYRMKKDTLIFDDLSNSNDCDTEPTPPSCLITKYIIPVAEGCDMQQCKLVLYDKEDGYINLRRDLKEISQTFSYTVTPQQQTQKITLLNKKKDRLGIMIQLALTNGNQDTSLMMDQLNAVEEEAELLERHPVVVSFGDWLEKAKPDNKNKTSDDKKKSDDETSFGWLIRPRLTTNNNLQSQGFRHLAAHYSLSSVISIPSWWKSANIEITTCWFDDRKFRSNNAWLCDTNTNKPHKYMIRLPGNVKEINQKLGIDVIKAPYVTPTDNGQPNQTVESGRKGTILLEGERLWRSTVVMLDNQKADRIEVLPNMQAVLAEFECVHPMTGSSPPPDSISIVRLWTSEGVTKDFPIELQPFAEHYNGEAPCYVKDKDKGENKSSTVPN